MIQLFIELTNQIFWEGYAEQLAANNPAVFQMELADFMNAYNEGNHVRYRLFFGESHA